MTEKLFTVRLNKNQTKPKQSGIVSVAEIRLLNQTSDFFWFAEEDHIVLRLKNGRERLQEQERLRDKYGRLHVYIVHVHFISLMVRKGQGSTLGKPKCRVDFQFSK